MESLSTTSAADLYLTNCRIRAEIPMLGFNRLSDVLNNIPGMFMHGVVSQIGDEASGRSEAGEVPECDIVVRLHDVLFVCPLATREAGLPPPSVERRDRLQQRVVMQVGGWRISGSLHLVDHVRWVDFATAVNTRFVPVTDAVLTPPGDRQPFDCSFVLVNGARLSALYERPA